MSEPLKFFFLRFSNFLGPDLNVSSKNTSFTAKQNFKNWVQIARISHFFELLFSFFFSLFSFPPLFSVFSSFFCRFWGFTSQSEAGGRTEGRRLSTKTSPKGEFECLEATSTKCELLVVRVTFRIYFFWVFRVIMLIFFDFSCRSRHVLVRSLRSLWVGGVEFHHFFQIYG